jgi:hypothetical protein
MKNLFTLLAFGLCYLICIVAFAQPPDPEDPDDPNCSDFAVGVVYSENTYGTVGIPEYYNICNIANGDDVDFTVISLPPGYTLYTSSSGCADIYGTMMESGTFSFVIAASTTQGCTDTLTFTSTWTCINNGFDTAEFPPFNIGDDVHEGFLGPLLSSFGVALDFEVTAGTLPPGLSIVPSPDGMYDAYLTGQPTTPGIYTFTVRAYRGTNCPGGEQQYTVTIEGADRCSNFTLEVVHAENTYGIVGVPEYYEICNVTNADPVQFTALSLPAGYALNSDGQGCADLHGTITEPGTFSFVILGTTAQGCSDTLTITSNWTCLNSGFDPTELPTLNAGAYIHEGFQGPLLSYAGVSTNFEVSAGALPPGLSLVASSDGLYDAYLTGTPTTSGIYTFTLRAYLGDCEGTQQTYTVEVLPCPVATAITPTASELPYPIENIYFEQRLVAAFDVPVTEVHYSIVDGALPYGLTLRDTAQTEAVLKGIPGTQGDFTFTIRVSVGGCTAIDQVYSIRLLGGLAPLPLVITPLCADSIGVRNWVVYNPNDVTNIYIDWELLYAPEYHGKELMPPGYTTFSTPNVMNPNTIKISWQDGITGTKTLIRGASSELCNPPACVIAASVVSYHQGLQKNGQPVPPQFSDARQALGEPDANDMATDPSKFFSLGYNGFLVLELSSNLYDQPGNDLVVHETSYGDPSFSSHPERAEVFVSQNGTQWTSLGLTGSSQQCNDPLDKAFDLAGKITWCRYIKVVDKTDRHAKILTPITCLPTTSLAFNETSNGFDVDAITCGSYTSNLSLSARMAFPEGTTIAREYVVYPNPVQEQFTLDLSQDDEFILLDNREVQLDIVDMNGRPVYQKLHTLEPDLTTKCDASNFKSGMFVVHVRTPKGSRYYKLIKQ